MEDLIKSYITQLLFLSVLLLLSAQIVSSLPTDKITFKDDKFHISVLASVAGARQIALSSDNSVLFVGTTGDSVYAVPLSISNRQVRAQEPFPVASGLKHPTAVAVEESTGDLYIGEVQKINKISRAVSSVKSGGSVSDVNLVRNYDYPSDSWHAFRYIKFHKNRLYVPVSIPCNVCPREDPFGTMTSFDHTKSDQSQQDYRTEARGIRNSVGFDWHPSTGELWFTDNGRDNWGDERPGDELNRVTGSNMHFGFPYCHEKNLPDPELNPSGSCEGYTPATYALGPHVASLGMTFYTGTMFPRAYRNKIFIAEHGSWDRSTPIGYRITMVDPSKSDASSYEVFASGWLDLSSRSIRDSEQAWGRPVDVLQMKDGSLLVSDDKSGTVYRITYGDSGSTGEDPSPAPSGEATSPSEDPRTSNAKDNMTIKSLTVYLICSASILINLLL